MAVAEHPCSPRRSSPTEYPEFPDQPHRKTPALAAAAVSRALCDLPQRLHSPGLPSPRFLHPPPPAPLPHPPPPAPRRLVPGPRR